MRRSRASADTPVHWRSGVTASVRHRKRSVQSPSERIRVSAGLGPSARSTTPHTSQTSGSNAAANSTGLVAGCNSSDCTTRRDIRLEPLLQVHAGVQLPDLRLVAVEHQRRALLREQVALAEAALGGLAPARMVD